MGGRTDSQLIAAIARGEDDALSELLDAHGSWALAVARRFVNDPDLAQDALQESLIHLVQKAGGLLVADSIRPWFYSVIRFRAMDQQRRATKNRQAPLTGESPEQVAPSMAGHQDPDGVLRSAVGQLPETLREVLILRVVDGLSVGQTAIALGIPEGTVKSRLHAALGRLREQPGLIELMGGEGPVSDRESEKP